MPDSAGEQPDHGPAMVMLWDEARRQLVRQEAALDTLRTQAVAVLSVASIVAGLFGSQVTRTNQPGSVDLAVGAALALFATTAVVAIVILWPRTWAFSHDLGDIFSKVERQVPVDADDLSYTWAKHFESWRATNATKLKFLTCCFSLSCALSGLQVLAWGLAIIQPRLFP
jgi:hypothetical protein